MQRDYSNNPAEVDATMGRWALARGGFAMALGWSTLTGSLISLVGGLVYLGYTMSPLSPMASYFTMDYVLLIVFMGFCLWEGLLAGMLAGLGQALLLMVMTLGFGSRRPGQAYRRAARVIGIVVFLASVWCLELVISRPENFLTPGAYYFRSLEGAIVELAEAVLAGWWSGGRLGRWYAREVLGGNVESHALPSV